MNFDVPFSVKSCFWSLNLLSSPYLFFSEVSVHLWSYFFLPRFFWSLTLFLLWKLVYISENVISVELSLKYSSVWNCFWSLKSHSILKLTWSLILFSSPDLFFSGVRFHLWGYFVNRSYFSSLKLFFISEGAFYLWNLVYIWSYFWSLGLIWCFKSLLISDLTFISKFVPFWSCFLFLELLFCPKLLVISEVTLNLWS